MLQRIAAVLVLISTVVQAYSDADGDSTGIVVKAGHSAVVACNAPDLSDNQYLYWNRLDRDTSDVREVLFWSRKPQQTSNEKFVVSVEGFNLEIKDVTMEDSAWYECYVVNVETNMRISSRRTFLSVIDTPECSSTQLSGSPGDLVTLSCTPRIRQHQESNEVAVRWQSQLSPDFSSNQATIHVNLSESLNNAVFKCTTELAGVSTTCVLDPFDVKFPPQKPAIFVSGGMELSSANYSVLLGTANFSLTCHSRGNPEPQIVWYYGETMLGSNESLVLAEVKMNHAGKYRCESVSSLNGVPYRLTRELEVTVTKFRPQAIQTTTTMSMGIIIGASLACVLGACAVTVLILWVMRARVGRITILAAPSWLSGPWRRGGKGHIGLNSRANGSNGYHEADGCNVEKGAIDGDDTLTTPLNTASSNEDSVGENISSTKQVIVNELGKHLDADDTKQITNNGQQQQQ